jgi:cellulose synthase operon protein C
MVLLSDDLRYRQVGFGLAELPGTWLQAALASSVGAGVVGRERAAKAYVALAAHKHDHLRLDAGVLLDIYRSADAELRELNVVTDFIGSQTADMRSHTLVVYHFVSGLWSESKGDLRSQRATGMILSKLLRFRSSDWFVWAGMLLLGTNRTIDQYITAWLRGHFLPDEPVAEAMRRWRGAQRHRHVTRALRVPPLPPRRQAPR